jgi:hypothetical protein
MSKKAFIAYRMILKDLKEYTANEMPTINKFDLQYFETYMLQSSYSETAYLVDIKSAYATILFNDGFISEKTYRFISNLPKKARLAAVGMLASRKDVFYFQGEQLTGHDKIINPLENYFWYCVKRTGEIMDKIKKDTFPLFYWVDGMYFLHKSDAEKCKEILKENNYLFSEKKIFSFICEVINNDESIKNNISFFQSSEVTEYSELTKKNSEFKKFQIPLKNKLKDKLINYLMYDK